MQECDFKGMDRDLIVVNAVKCMNSFDEVSMTVETGLVDEIRNLCQEMGFNCAVEGGEGNFARVVARRISVEGEGVENSEEFVLPMKPEEAFNSLLDPTILMAVIPQFKGIRKLSEKSYMISIKWLFSWETPLIVSGDMIKNSGLVKYTAEQKVGPVKVMFGFIFFVYSLREGSGVRVKEWYKGPLQSFAKREIDKHLQRAKSQIPVILSKTT